eukprot:scaffold188_cov429-Prasinococcus_capsulatus_cf.AAC.17
MGGGTVGSAAGGTPEWESVLSGHPAHSWSHRRRGTRSGCAGRSLCGGRGGCGATGAMSWAVVAAGSAQPRLDLPRRRRVPSCTAEGLNAIVVNTPSCTRACARRTDSRKRPRHNGGLGHRGALVLTAAMGTATSPRWVVTPGWSLPCQRPVVPPFAAIVIFPS